MALRNAGQLRHWVELLKPVEKGKDRYNREVIRYEAVLRVPCAVRDMSAREYLMQDAAVREKVVTFSMRSQPFLREDMRIGFRGQQYDILYINHLGYHGQFMDVKARLVEGQAVSYGENKR